MNDFNSERASAEAVHKAKNAQQAIETAREAQNAKLVEDTKTALLEGLKEVFGASDSENPAQMKVLVRRIPILCTNIENMHNDISELKDYQKWQIRLIIGGIVSIIVAVAVASILR